MSRYFVRRILETIPLMLIISIFVFMFIHLIPGDPARSIAGLDAEEWEVEAIREEYGLNKPIVTQYVDYMVKLFHGDMGRSMKSDTPVTELIADRMPQTLKLVFAGVIWAPALGIFIGVISAIKHGMAAFRRSGYLEGLHPAVLHHGLRHHGGAGQILPLLHAGDAA